MAVGTVLKLNIAKYLQLHVLVIMHPASLLLSVNNIEKNAHNSKDDQNSGVGIADDPQGKEWVVCTRRSGGMPSGQRVTLLSFSR